MKLPPKPSASMYGGVDAMLDAYGLACARAALEQAAKVCENERFVFSDEEWRIRCELADAIRALAKEIT